MLAIAFNLIVTCDETFFCTYCIIAIAHLLSSENGLGNLRTEQVESCQFISMDFFEQQNETTAMISANLPHYTKNIYVLYCE